MRSPASTCCGGASGLRSKNMKGASTFCAFQGISRALGHLVDAQADAVEHVGQAEAAGADHFRQRLRVGPVGRRAVRARRCPGAELKAISIFGLGIDQRETAGQRLALLGERIAARRIEHDHAGLDRQRRRVDGCSPSMRMASTGTSVSRAILASTGTK